MSTSKSVHSELELILSLLRKIDGESHSSLTQQALEQAIRLTKSLQEKPTRLEHVVQNTSSTLYSCPAKRDLAPTFVTGNIHLFGLTAEDVIAKPELWIEQIHPDDRDRVLSDRSRVLKSGRHQPRKWPHLAKWPAASLTKSITR